MQLPDQTQILRREVRSFLAAEIEQGGFVPRPDNWLGGVDTRLSRALGERGWLGMSYPPEYGGAGASALDRFVVTEELLAAGAPVAAHWIAERQMAPSILRWGNEEQKRRFVPGVARGEVYFAIGMSEPDSGSDLASVRTRAEPVEGGWRVNGTKVWTSNAHAAHYLMALVRTAPRDLQARHEGLSQLIIDLAAEGVVVRPIVSLDGAHHFNEVVLEDVFVPAADLLGTVGEGWKQCTSELALERSGPERVFSTVPLLAEWVKLVRSGQVVADAHARQVLGGLVARLFRVAPDVVGGRSRARVGREPRGRSGARQGARYPVRGRVGGGGPHAHPVGCGAAGRHLRCRACWRPPCCTLPDSPCAAARTRCCAGSSRAVWGCGD